MNDSVQDIYTLQIRRQVNPHGGSPFCDACKNGFVHVNSLQVRQFTQSGKLPGVCKSCNDAFLKICRLQIRHLTRITPNPHTCSTCGKSFSHAGNYRKHVLLHEQRRISGEDTPDEKGASLQPPFDCDKCGRSFLKYGSFVKHVKNHDVVQKFVCNICEKSFQTKSILRAHAHVHAMETTHYACKLCKEKFVAPEDLEEHLLRHVEEQNKCINEGSGKIKSEEKPKAIVSEARAATKEQGQQYFKHFCRICQKGFVHLGALKNHSMQHSGNLAYECKLCNQKFVHAINLKKHSLMHTSGDKAGTQKKAESDQDANTSQSGGNDADSTKQKEGNDELELETAEADQTEVVLVNGKSKTKHFCSICKKGFVNLGALKNHFSMHSGNLAFKCRKCNKEFFHAGHLKKHSKKHSKLLYSCKMCKKVYKNRKCLKTHLAMHTNV